MLDVLETVLREKCGLCDECIQLYMDVDLDACTSTNTDKDRNEGSSSSSNTTMCPLCLGLLSKGSSNDDTFHNQLMNTVKEKFQPYSNSVLNHEGAVDMNTNMSINSISKESPTIALPNIILIIAHCISCTLEQVILQQQQKESTDGSSSTSRDKYNIKRPIDIYNKIKDKIRAKARKIIIAMNNENNAKILQHCNQNGKNGGRSPAVPSSVPNNEEAGYLKFHLIFTTPLLFPYLPFSSSTTRATMRNDTRSRNIFSLPQLSTKRERKRFRGNDPGAKQGGDARNNLLSFVKIQLASLVNEFQDKYITNTSTNSDDTKMDCHDDNNNDIKVKNTQQIHVLQSTIVKDNVHCCLVEKNIILKHLETIGSRNEVRKKISEWMLKEVSSLRQEYTSIESNSDDSTINDKFKNVGVFASCWRNHFYLKGKYTKSRRDISQTPFYVNNDDANKNKHDEKCNNEHEKNSKQQKAQDTGSNYKCMKRLGISSVEEEICPIISNIACNGISNKNNEPTASKTDNNDSGGNLVYGMCKFHASGREDMDVRMILPPEAKDEHLDKKITDKEKIIGSGRPFVCEVIDAYKLPTAEDLNKVVQTINQNGNGSNYSKSSVLEEIEITGDGKWVHEDARTHIQYGKNTNGVGISGLTYCHASSFSNLQSETEDKVKFYGCLCWSSLAIPSQAYLDEKLIKSETEGSIYPLRIEQSTPLRVLHRRSAGSRIRHVLSLNAKRIDEHWFRLHLSTSAGAYVKEFCHGDCGRTKPSISSLLGSKVDIVELDCEGIAM
jgi:tRNA U54 and U55 pseudouridine synthase Pus10